MRTRGPTYAKAVDAVRGRTAPSGARGTLRLVDEAGNDVVVSTIRLPGDAILELDDDDALVDIETGIGTVGDGTTTIEDVTDLTVPPGGATDLGAGAIQLNFLTPTLGEQHVVRPLVAGATQTLDLSGGNWFDLTLTEACTLSFSNPPASGAGGIWTIILRGDFDVTWPTEVGWGDENGDETATPPTMRSGQNVVVITTLDGGMSFGASLENGSNGGSAGASTRWELAVITGSPPDNLYADGDWLYIEVPV